MSAPAVPPAQKQSPHALFVFGKELVVLKLGAPFGLAHWGFDAFDGVPFGHGEAALSQTCDAACKPSRGPAGLPHGRVLP